MAKKIINRAELNATAEAADAQRARNSRSQRDAEPPIDPVFRVLKLNDGLLNTYFSWCPAARMPAVAPHGKAPIACGQLRLQMQQLAGLRHLWDLVGKSGWMVMEAVWIDSSPHDEYLLFAAHVARGSSAGKAIVPIHLWQLWQPSYAPRFVWRPKDMTPPSVEMRAALDATLDQHLAESAKQWVSRKHAADRCDLESRIEVLNQRVAELDDERRVQRKATRAGDSRTAAVRRELLAFEQQLAELTESLGSLQLPTPPAIRQRLCEVQWFVQAPAPRADWL
jgi:hypothetical protein